MTTLGGTPTLIGLPYDASSSYQRGPADAPAAIREALWSPSANSWTELGVNIGAEGVITDAGDLELGALCAGGCTSYDRERDHAPARDGRPTRVARRRSLRDVPGAPRRSAAGAELTILHVDAHPDLYDEFEGDRFSHACPFARIMEEELADRLVQVGIRTMTGHQRAQARRFGVEVIEMRHVRDDLRIALDTPVYVSDRSRRARSGVCARCLASRAGWPVGPATAVAAASASTCRSLRPTSWS